MRAVTGDDHGQLKIVDLEGRSIRRHASDISSTRAVRSLAWTGRHIEGEDICCRTEEELTVGRENGVVQAFDVTEVQDSKFELLPSRQFRLPSPCVYVQSLSRCPRIGCRDGLVAVGAMGEVVVVDWKGNWKVSMKSSWCEMEEALSVVNPSWLKSIDCGSRMRNRTKKSMGFINPEAAKAPVDWAEWGGRPFPGVSTKKKSWLRAGYSVMGPVTAACLDDWTDSGRLLVGGLENDVKLIDLTAGECKYAARNVRPNKLHYTTDIDVTALGFAGAISPELLLAGNREGSLRLYDMRSSKYPVMGVQGTMENRPITSIACRPAWVHSCTEEEDDGEVIRTYYQSRRESSCSNMGIIVADTHGMLYRYELRRLDAPFLHPIYDNDPLKPLSKKRKIDRKLHRLDRGCGEVIFNEPDTCFEFQMKRSYRGVVGSPEDVRVHENGLHVLACSLESKLHLVNLKRTEIEQTVGVGFITDPDISQESCFVVFVEQQLVKICRMFTPLMQQPWSNARKI